MKKRLMSILLAASMVMGMGTMAFAEEDTYKVGLSIFLGNVTWAELAEEAKVYAPTIGIDLTVVDNNDNAATQVSQIENFITSGMDAIIVCAVESQAVADVCQQAMDEGIKIIAYTQVLENYDVGYYVDAFNTGYACGEAAAKWINENYADAEEVQWALEDLPRYPEIIDRANGIIAGIEENTTNTKLVATAPAEVNADGVANAETFMQAHPDLKVICAIGSGGGAGANEGVKAYIEPEDYDKFGIFGIDATEPEIMNIINGDPQKTSVSLGGAKTHGVAMVDMAYNFWKGIEQEKDQYLPISVVDSTNAQEYYDNMFGE